MGDNSVPFSPDKSAPGKSPMLPLTSRYKDSSPYRQPIVWKQLQLEEEKRAQRDKVRNAQKTKILMMEYHHFQYDNDGRLSIHRRRRKIMKRKKYIRPLSSYLDRRLHVKSHVHVDTSNDPVLLNGLSYIDYCRWPDTEMRDHRAPLLRPESPKPSPLKRTSMDMNQYLLESKQRESDRRIFRRRQRQKEEGLLYDIDDSCGSSESESEEDDERVDITRNEFEGLGDEEIRNIFKIRNLLTRAVEVCDKNNIGSASSPLFAPPNRKQVASSIVPATTAIPVSSSSPPRTDSSTLPQPTINISQWMQETKKQRQASLPAPLVPSTSSSQRAAEQLSVVRPATAHPVSVSGNNSSSFHQYFHDGHSNAHTIYLLPKHTIVAEVLPSFGPLVEKKISLPREPNEPLAHLNIPEKRLSPREIRQWKDSMTVQEAAAQFSPEFEEQVEKMTLGNGLAQRNLISAFDEALNGSERGSEAQSVKTEEARNSAENLATQARAVQNVGQQFVQNVLAHTSFPASKVKIPSSTPSPPSTTVPSLRPAHHSKHQYQQRPVSQSLSNAASKDHNVNTENDRECNDENISSKGKGASIASLSLGGAGFLSALKSKKLGLNKVSRDHGTAATASVVISEEEYSERLGLWQQFVTKMEHWQVISIEDLQPIADTPQLTSHLTGAGKPVPGSASKLLGRGKFSAVYALSSLSSSVGTANRQGLTVHINVPTIFNCSRFIPTNFSSTGASSTTAAWKLAQYNSTDSKKPLPPPRSVLLEYQREIETLIRMHRILQSQSLVSTNPVFQSSSQQSTLESVSSYRHAPIVSLLGYTTHPFGLVLEYVHGPGDLFQFVEQLLRASDDSVSQTICRENWLLTLVDLTHGLCLMHEHAHFIHRDVKPHNIMIRETTASIANLSETVARKATLQRYRAVVADLGTAISLSYSPLQQLQSRTSEGSARFPMLQDVVGTQGYIAPEVLACEELGGISSVNVGEMGYSYPADVFSAGQVIRFVMEAVSKLYLFEDSSAQWIIKVREILLPRMLHSLPASRPTMRQVYHELRQLWENVLATY
jgi:serine/threonine protein kinase